MKIALLLSGGVDSSTALRRLLEQGRHDVTAYYLKIWLEDDTAYLGECPWEEDLRYAEAVCRAAGVPLEVVPLQLEYYDKVVSYALAELRAGRTPSPDIFCNQRVKFGAFVDHLSQGFDKIASGHYARVDWVASARPRPGERGVAPDDPSAGKGGGRWRLLRGPDPVKDQSYFLSHLSQGQVAKVLFPIGDLLKSRVRDLAQAYDLANKDRPDSQGICFLGKIAYPDFVRHYLGEREGAIVELETGRELGRHQGYWFHTVGQRTGLRLGNGPWYVSAKDCGRNIVYASHASHRAERERSRMELAELTWIAGQSPTRAELESWRGRLWAKLRHGPQLTACRLDWLPGSGPDGAALEGAPAAESVQAAEGGASPAQWRLSLELDKADPGVAAGQFAVLYLDEECLGGGKIQELDADELDRLYERHAAWRREADAEAAARLRAKRAKAAERRRKYAPRPEGRA